MRTTPASVRQQTMVILGSGSETISSDPAITYHSNSSVSVFLDLTIRSESRILKTYFSSVPVIWQWELSQGYQELGEALSELTALEAADEWKIDMSVYDAARRVAAQLMDNSFPAPRIFNHGPESVVFNWSDETDNLYLTISANKISALISSPERIKRRVNFSANQLLNPAALLPFFGSAQLERPVISVSSAVSDLPDFVG
jgi:hypothetical protein